MQNRHRTEDSGPFELTDGTVRLRLLDDRDLAPLVVAARHSPCASAPSGADAVARFVRRAQSRRAHGLAVTLTVEWECLAPSAGAFSSLEPTWLVVGTATVDCTTGSLDVWMAGTALMNGVMERTLELVRADLPTLAPEPGLPAASGE